MFESHPIFVEPDPESKIWRYMDFSKFCSLLDKKSLFFAVPSALGDKFEGSYPKNKNQEIPYFQSKEIWNDKFNICCFHMNEHESFALWKLYTSVDYGIAIQTEFKNLKKAFDICTDKEIFCGKVIYRDYDEKSSDTIIERNCLAPFLSKRKCFEYENECRAIFWDTPYLSKYCQDNKIPFPNTKSEMDKILDKKNGIYIPVNLNFLILNVYCSPDSPEWFVELVKSTIKKYGYEFNVIKSPLNDDPSF